MDKNGVVTISQWYKGQESHPIAGFGLLKNVEVFENKGLASIKKASILDTNITPTQLPIALAVDDSGNKYIATGETGQGAVYKNGTSIQTGLSNLRDIKIYKNYLFVRYGEFLSMYGPLTSGSAQWFGGYSGFNTSYNAQLLVGQDDFLYITNGNEVRKVEVTASGVVGVQPTLNTSNAVLDLPDGQYATCLTEFGTKIAIGTQGGSSYSERGNTPTARLYTWNRQAGTLGNPGLADLPVNFNENGLNAMMQYANKLYVSAGTQGSIYVTDSTNFVKLTSLPYTSTVGNSNSTVFSNAIDISARGTLLVGLSCDQDEFSRPGVYEIDINAAGNPVSFSTVSSTAGLTGKIGFVDAISYNTLKVGWSDGSTYGVDTTSNSTYSSFGGVIESSLIKVGRAKAKKTLQHIEWTIADPLETAQSIRISYRKNSKDDYTAIGTWDFATYGAITSFEDVAGISDADYIQIKVELDQDAGATKNINLISVTLW